ncbi:hypothetical protein [Phenylobacterium koreense]|uniref:Uncharacterized protein n=1 Tax=Phenylobacterium koreense TaxID=266125 RepID=A0ABV2EGN5_9CAUL
MSTFAELGEGDLFLHEVGGHWVFSIKGADGLDFAILVASVDGTSEWALPAIDRPEDHASVLAMTGALEIEALPECDEAFALPTKMRGPMGATPNGALVVDGAGEAWIAITFRGPVYYNLRLGREGTPGAGRLIFARWRIVRRGSSPERDLTIVEVQATTSR